MRIMEGSANESTEKAHRPEKARTEQTVALSAQSGLGVGRCYGDRQTARACSTEHVHQADGHEAAAEESPGRSKLKLGRVVHWAELFARLRQSARALKREVHAIYLASRDPRTPWYAKAAAICIAAYALSPIDLIPDFIPVLGHLDELILLPLAIVLVIKVIPPEVMAEHRITAAAAENRPVSRAGAAVIVAIWVATVAFWP